jgi:hypothetical protein
VLYRAFIALVTVIPADNGNTWKLVALNVYYKCRKSRWLGTHCRKVKKFFPSDLAPALVCKAVHFVGYQRG